MFWKWHCTHYSFQTTDTHLKSNRATAQHTYYVVMAKNYVILCYHHAINTYHRLVFLVIMYQNKQFYSILHLPHLLNIIISSFSWRYLKKLRMQIFLMTHHQPTPWVPDKRWYPDRNYYFKEWRGWRSEDNNVTCIHSSPSFYFNTRGSSKNSF